MPTLTLKTLSACLLTALAMPALAEDSEPRSLFGVRAASVTFGPYIRAELGSASPDLNGGNWLPPGQGSPRVYFDLNEDSGGYGYLGAGYDWMNGFRADAGLAVFGSTDLSSPAGTTLPPDGSLHAAITGGSMKSRAIMANLFYSPLEQRGSASRFQPFVSFALGIACNSVSDWTRTNPGSVRDDRTFEGDASTGVAWSIGAGFAYQISAPGRHPVILEFAYRYFDLGEAQGGTEPLPRSGASTAREALNFDVRQSVVTVGLRVPLQRY